MVTTIKYINKSCVIVYDYGASLGVKWYKCIDRGSAVTDGSISLIFRVEIHRRGGDDLLIKILQRAMERDRTLTGFLYPTVGT